jgi:hypothetical protein
MLRNWTSGAALSKPHQTFQELKTQALCEDGCTSMDCSTNSSNTDRQPCNIHPSGKQETTDLRVKTSISVHSLMTCDTNFSVSLLARSDRSNTLCFLCDEYGRKSSENLIFGTIEF